MSVTHFSEWSSFNVDMSDKQVVVVVGGGLAGLTAAISAADKGAHVYLIDKEAKCGGNSAKATSGINGVHTSGQKSRGIKDSEEGFVADTVKSGKGLSEEGLVSILASLSAEAISWLESHGLDLSCISQLGGHSAPRTHREPPTADGRARPVGWDIVSMLQGIIQKDYSDKITVINGARVTKLLHFERFNIVFGLEYEKDGETKRLKAGSVVLCTGGYSNDHQDDSLLAEFAPHVKHLPTTNGPFATGDGVRLARAVGAQLNLMDKVQVHPTGLVNPADKNSKTKFLAPEAMRGHGGLLFNAEGKRFCNELGTRDYVSDSIFQHCKPEKDCENTIAYLVLNGEAAVGFGEGVLGFYASKGFVTKVTGVDALASCFGEGAPAATVRSELEAHADGAKNGTDKHGKVLFPTCPTAEDTFYVAKVTPSIHYTMGGIRINNTCQVLGKHNKPEIGSRDEPIVGLFAAGEVTGGLHGANRLAGNSLLECAVFGKIAGERAALSKEVDAAMSPNEWTPLVFRERNDIAKDIFLLRFTLKSARAITGLHTGQYISLKVKVDGEELIRYYSPISRPDQRGQLDLLIKSDGKGVVSDFLNGLQYGDIVEFQGPKGGPELNFYDPGWPKKKIGMIAGGTGISPMVQILRSVLFYRKFDIEVKLIYCANDQESLPCHEFLDRKAAEMPNFDIYHVLANPPKDWAQGTGFLTADHITNFMFPPSDDLLVVVCGPPAMCKATKANLSLCGYEKDKHYYSYM